MPTGRSIRSRSRGAVVLITMALGMLFVACGDDADTELTQQDTETTQDTVDDAARDAREETENAFATLRTEGERLMDEFQTRNAPEAKEKLLEQCRDVLERLRKANSDQADRVDSLCNRIRETDPSDASMWREVRDEITKLRES